MALPETELLRAARHLALPGFGIEQQQRLYNSHVLVIGAGGLGCPLMQSLASAGVGTITVFDDDTVDITNIHRQILFGADDVDKLKVEVAAERLKQLQPGITINALAKRLTTDNAVQLVGSVGLVLDGSDSFSTKYLVADAAEITGTPLVWATVLRFHGDLALSHSGAASSGPVDSESDDTESNSAALVCVTYFPNNLMRIRCRTVRPPACLGQRLR